MSRSFLLVFALVRMVTAGSDFARICKAPRVSTAPMIEMTVYVDASSIELFADGGLTVMTALVFPSKPYTRVDVKSILGIEHNSFSLSTLKSIH